MLSGDTAETFYRKLFKEALTTREIYYSTVFTKIRTVRETYNTLFSESFKAYMWVLLELHRRGVCSFNELFEGSGLKGLGVSTHTVGRVIKALMGAGVVQKERAPFPFKSRYRLIKRDPVIDAYSNLLGRVITVFCSESLEQYRKLVEGWPRIAEYGLWIIVKHFAEGNSTYAAIVSFMLLDYLYHLVANMPEQLQSEVLTRLEKIIEEAPPSEEGERPETKLLKEILAKSA